MSLTKKGRGLLCRRLLWMLSEPLPTTQRSKGIRLHEWTRVQEAPIQEWFESPTEMEHKSPLPSAFCLLQLLPSRSKITYCKSCPSPQSLIPRPLSTLVFFYREGSKRIVVALDSPVSTLRATTNCTDVPAERLYGQCNSSFRRFAIAIFRHEVGESCDRPKGLPNKKISSYLLWGGPKSPPWQAWLLVLPAPQDWITYFLAIPKTAVKCYSRSRSSSSVTGPSFSIETCIIAPNWPVSTRKPLCRNFSTNFS